MPAYRNKADRRPFPVTQPQPIPVPIMTFTAESNGGADVVLEFSEPIILVDPNDPALLNSVRVWMPTENFEGTAESCAVTNETKLTFTFGQALGNGNEAAVWVFDQSNLIRGAATGARCTGNPSLFEGV